MSENSCKGKLSEKIGEASSHSRERQPTERLLAQTLCGKHEKLHCRQHLRPSKKLTKRQHVSACLCAIDGKHARGSLGIFPGTFWHTAILATHPQVPGRS
eukprot:6195593-Pleurochrysis_carterae.AAC.2